MESAHRGARHLGLGKVLVVELRHTLTGMAQGWLSEWRATLIARETGCLSAEHRAQIDAELARDRAAEVRGWGDARLVAEGGETSADNSQGLCEACNYAKEAPGWTARTVPAPVHTVATTTPTGHVYESTAPPLPGAPATIPTDPLDDQDREALLEHLLAQYAA